MIHSDRPGALGGCKEGASAGETPKEHWNPGTEEKGCQNANDSFCLEPSGV